MLSIINLQVWKEQKGYLPRKSCFPPWIISKIFFFPLFVPSLAPKKFLSPPYLIFVPKSIPPWIQGGGHYASQSVDQLLWNFAKSFKVGWWLLLAKNFFEKLFLGACLGKNRENLGIFTKFWPFLSLGPTQTTFNETQTWFYDRLWWNTSEKFQTESI